MPRGSNTTSPVVSYYLYVPAKTTGKCIFSEKTKIIGRHIWISCIFFEYLNIMTHPYCSVVQVWGGVRCRVLLWVMLGWFSIYTLNKATESNCRGKGTAAEWVKPQSTIQHSVGTPLYNQLVQLLSLRERRCIATRSLHRQILTVIHQEQTTEPAPRTAFIMTAAVSTALASEENGSQDAARHAGPTQ